MIKQSSLEWFRVADILEKYNTHVYLLLLTFVPQCMEGPFSKLGGPIKKSNNSVRFKFNVGWNKVVSFIRGCLFRDRS